MARVAAARGDLAGAEATLRQIVDTRRRSDLPGGLPLAATLLALGEVLLARDQAVAAEPMLREALDLRLRELLPRHKDVAAARGALGASLAAQRRYADAEPLLAESLAGLRGRPVARQAAARLVHLYEAWGRPEKAAAYGGVAARR
jgi:serine/threonine-protein kinase